MSTYVFDAGWQKERERLRALESSFDGASTRFLAALGVAEGWRCLEIGCGAGGVALWLARQVGPPGPVVATDLDIRFIEPAGRPNLEVREHDILAEPLAEASFDLAHARAVIEHVADKQRALERLTAAIRPGGWLLIEDVHFAGPMAAALGRYAYPPRYGPATERSYRAIEKVFAAVGADAGFGPRLPGLLKEVGLVDVGGESHAPIMPGATEGWVRGTIEQLSERKLETGLVTAADLELFLSAAADETSHYATPFITSAWGRRPAARQP